MADDATRVIALERLLDRKQKNFDKQMDRCHRQIRQLKAQLAAEKAKNSDEPLKIINLACPSCMSMLDGRGS